MDRTARPLRSMNILQPGQKLVYAPLDLPNDRSKQARVAMILIPSDSSSPNRPELAILDPKPASGSAEWTIPFRTRSVGLVFGPQGLDKGKLNSLLKKDRELIAQMADYAEKTAQTEALIDTLAAWDRTPNATENMNSALLGFSTRYGVALPKLDRNAPTDQQATVLMHALNPSLSTFDPLAPDPALRMQQSAALAASVAGLFLGNTVGLAAGGASMFLSLRTMLFPGTDFRSALVNSPEPANLTLCAKREPQKSKTRVAYLWAVRIPDTAAPAVTFPRAAHLPAGTKSTAYIRLASTSEWRWLDRLEQWRLVPQAGEPVPVKVRPIPESQALEIDLSGLNPPPGLYRLAANWDWDTVQVAGEIHLHKLPDLTLARLAPVSRDRLIAGAGEMVLRLEGPDFQFLRKVVLQRTGERNSVSLPLEFTLPESPQAHLEIFLNTSRLSAGAYRLLLTQSGGREEEVPVRILPPHPVVSSLPLRANLGQTEQRFTLQGTGLDRIQAIECSDATITLFDPTAGGRPILIRLGDGLFKGDRLELALRIEGVQQPVRLPEALQILPPRPRIGNLTVSLPENLGIELRPGELPAGLASSFSLPTGPLEGQPTLHLFCFEPALLLRKETLRSTPLMNNGSESIFFSLDPGAVGQPGCSLSATVATAEQGTSDPRIIGKIVGLPRIESFRMTAERAGEQAFIGVLNGWHLETIEKTGWDPSIGLPVQGLPSPAAEPSKQNLKILLSWPSPAPRSPLYIWLRGEPVGRRTTSEY